MNDTLSPQYRTILAIDTTTPSALVCVAYTNQLLSWRELPAQAGARSQLIPTISAALAEARLKLEQVELFAVGIGPGSFTGTRVGLSAVQSLAYSLSRPVLPVPTPLAMCYTANAPIDRVMTMLVARQALVIVGEYERRDARWQSCGPVWMGAVEEVIARVHRPTWFWGSGFQRHASVLSTALGKELAGPESWSGTDLDGTGLLSATIQMLDETPPVTADQLQPLYSEGPIARKVADRPLPKGETL